MIAKDQTVLRYWASRANLFDDYYTDPSWFDRVFRKAIFLRAMVAIDVCRKLPEPTVLDVGSGPGINSVALIQEGHARAVTGIDFAESMNELAREQARSRGVDDRCHFIQGDFMGHSFDAKSFDLVVALGVFDYVDEPRQFLTRIAEYARASVVVSWPEAGLRMLLRQARYSCPVRSYTESRIRDLHRSARLSQLELLKVPGGWVSTASARPD